jgi:predicted NACHT family NTPase
MKDNIIITAFVSCPRDAEKYKQIVREVAEDITNKLGQEKHFSIKIIDYKKSVTPYLGPTAQTVINEQTDGYDIFIGIYCSRFGTATGNRNATTNFEFESGSEEEYFRATERNSDNNLPISLFFSTKVGTPNTSAKAEQLTKLLNFKESLIKSKQYIVDFNSKTDFWKKVNDFLYDSCNKLIRKVTISDKLNIDKIKNTLSYKPVDEYLPRTVMLYKDAISAETAFISLLVSKDLTEIIKINNRIVLLSDAGYGKTTELQRLAAFYSGKESIYFPVLIKLNTYTNERIEDLISPNWGKVPEQSLLLIIDALDEVESKNRNNLIKRLEKFSEDYPLCKIIVSCRTNFYIAETDTNSATILSFSTYMLNPLVWEDGQNYISKKLEGYKDDFINAVQNNKTSDLLVIPFYLKFLVDKYKMDKKLPSTRADIFDTLIRSRIRLDEEHFRTSSDHAIAESRELVMNNLMKLSLAMEILGRNYITIQEFTILIPEEKTRRLLEQKTLFNNRGNIWQIEHHSFQEYLAAKALASKSLGVLKKIIAFGPRYKIIIPSWINTLSFLLNLYQNYDLKKWILEIQPELTIKFEPDKIGLSFRRKIFIKIFNDYKEKKIWINSERYDLYELAHFGESEETIKYLLKHINTLEYHTIIGNAIILLSHMKIPDNYKGKIINTLLNIAINYNSPNIQSYAIMALSSVEPITKEIIDYLLEKLGNSDNDYHRYSLYSMIEESVFINDYIYYFLSGIKYLHKSGRIGNESWHLENGLKKATDPEAIIRILEYFIDNPAATSIIGFDRVIPTIMNNASDIYLKTNNETIFNKVMELYLIFQQKYLIPEIKYCISFFTNSNTTSKLFNDIYRERNKYQPDQFFVYLAHIANNECNGIIIKEYQEHNLNNDDIGNYQIHLRQNSWDLYESFNNRINEISNNRFKVGPQRDFEKERIEKTKKDHELLFNQDQLLFEIKSIYINEKREVLDSDLIRDLKYHRWTNNQVIYSNISLEILEELLKNEDKCYEKIYDDLKKYNWEQYSVNEIYEYLINKKSLSLTDYQLDCLGKWCLMQTSTFDFSKAVKEKDNTTAVSNISIYLWTFLREFKFKYPKNVLLDMVSYDWTNAGIDYLEELLPLNEIKKRIFSNIKKEYNTRTELVNYIHFFSKHKIKSAKRFAEDKVINSKMNEGIRELALQLLETLGTNNNKLIDILKKLEDPFRWKLVELLIKRKSEEISNYLTMLLNKGTKEEKLKSALYLISIDNISGLEFYTSYLIIKKEFMPQFHRDNPLSNIKSIKAVPSLLKLLNLSYDKELKQDEYNSLYRSVEQIFTNIALKNERNFKFVVKKLIEYIAANRSKNDDVNYLYSYLDRLERQFYFSKSKNLSIDDVLIKLKLVS